MKELPERTFFAQSIELFGREDAYEIGEAFVLSMEYSYNTLPLMYDVRGIKMLFAESRSNTLMGFANCREDVVSFVINPNANVDRLIHDIPPVVVHEFAHLAHSGQNPDLYFHSDNRLFRSVVQEAIADYAASKVDESYSPSGALEKRRKQKRACDDTLIDVLYDEQYQPEYYEFVFGDETLPRRAYVVGEYLVASMVLELGYDVEQLMKTSLGEFKEFAETKL